MKRYARQSAKTFTGARSVTNSQLEIKTDNPNHCRIVPIVMSSFYELPASSEFDTQ